MVLIICNDQDPPQVDIVLFGLSLSGSPSRGFHTLINGGLFSSPTNVGHHNPPPLRGPVSSLALFSSSNRCGTAPKSTPLWGPTSLLAHHLVSTPLRKTARRLAHCPVSGSDTICNDPDPPQADIVLFALSLLGSPSRL